MKKISLVLTTFLAVIAIISSCSGSKVNYKVDCRLRPVWTAYPVKVTYSSGYTRELSIRTYPEEWTTDMPLSELDSVEVLFDNENEGLLFTRVPESGKDIFVLDLVEMDNPDEMQQMVDDYNSLTKEITENDKPWITFSAPSEDEREKIGNAFHPNPIAREDGSAVTPCYMCLEVNCDGDGKKEYKITYSSKTTKTVWRHKVEWMEICTNIPENANLAPQDSTMTIPATEAENSPSAVVDAYCRYLETREFDKILDILGDNRGNALNAKERRKAARFEIEVLKDGFPKMFSHELLGEEIHSNGHMATVLTTATIQGHGTITRPIMVFKGDDGIWRLSPFRIKVWRC